MEIGTGARIIPANVLKDANLMATWLSYQGRQGRQKAPAVLMIGVPLDHVLEQVAHRVQSYHFCHIGL